MGCVHEKPPRNNKQSTQKKQQQLKNNTTSKLKQGKESMNCRMVDVGEKGGREYPDLIDPITNDDSNSGADKDSKVIIQKYLVNVKESAYRTPAVHVYNYNQMLQFNPSIPSSQIIQSGIDKTLGGLQSSQLSDAHLKLLGSKH